MSYEHFIMYTYNIILSYFVITISKDHVELLIQHSSLGTSYPSHGERGRVWVRAYII